MKIRILIAITFLSVSCEKFLYDEDDKIGIINNQEELNNAITGIYGLFGDVFNDNLNVDPFLFACIMADDINLEPLDQENDHPCRNTNNKIVANDFYDIINIENNLYKTLYKTIVSTNNIIKQEDKIQNITQANTYIGEAYFIRSLCYFYLTRFFGEIPLVTNIEIKYNIKRASIPEIYKLIEVDMLKAIQLLPSSNETARIPDVTPHRGTAKAVLAEIYLNMAGFPLKDTEKYKLAAKYAGEVIDSAEFYGIGLVNNYAQLWDFDYYFNPEKVFGVKFIDDEFSGFGLQFSRSYSVGTTKTLYPRTQRHIIPEYNFYKDYPDSYRKKVSFYTGYYRETNYSIEDQDYDWVDMVELNPVEFCDFLEIIRYRKWLLNISYDVTALYLFRYAHTLLTYAEAKAKSGQLDASAYEAVNKIRRRANKLDINQPSVFDLQPGLSPGQFADSVVWERALEFCAEPEGRWFDILRLEMLEKIYASRYYYEPEVPWYSKITEENYFMDIPQEDMWLNPNLEPSNK